MINDPDGYTNIRSCPGTESEIVARVVTGESFYVIPKSREWLPVRTSHGIHGYMHHSRIKLDRSGSAAAVASPQWQSRSLSTLTGEAVYVDNNSISPSQQPLRFTYEIGKTVIAAEADCQGNQW